MKTLELKKLAALKNIIILSIKKDRKYDGYNVKYFTSYMNTTTSTKETYFSNKNEIEYWINEQLS